MDFGAFLQAALPIAGSVGGAMFGGPIGGVIGANAGQMAGNVANQYMDDGFDFGSITQLPMGLLDMFNKKKKIGFEDQLLMQGNQSQPNMDYGLIGMGNNSFGGSPVDFYYPGLNNANTRPWILG